MKKSQESGSSMRIAERRFRSVRGRGMLTGPIFYWMLLPFMGLFLLFTVLPVLTSVVLSFTDYDMISRPLFVGLQNYSRMFASDGVLLTVLLNTLKFAIITGPLGFILAFLLAWLINEFPPLMRGILAFLFYTPSLVGATAYLIWQVAFNGDSYGYLNSALLSVGIITDPIQWLKDPAYNTVIIMIVQLWMSMGVSFLSNLSGLQNVNEEIYEAGAIDGIRSRWHELWYLTLPSMKSILLFGAVMQIQAMFSVGPVIIALAGYPSVNNSVDTLISYITDVGATRYEMGYAAALSVLLFMMMAFFRLIVGNLMKLFGK